jgi:hypothetical protein
MPITMATQSPDSGTTMSGRMADTMIGTCILAL